nr:tigger transposable element-derived protein 1-like [Onthophagus taurus]
MEKMLSLWIDDAHQKNMPVSQAAICEKALLIFSNLKAQENTDETFLASTGWFTRFKSRTNICSTKLSGEAASADVAAAAAYPQKFQEIVEQGKYPADLIFNVDETGLYWKKLPSRTFISREERSAPGFKAAKDRLTVLLGSNVSGSLKFKPMVVYHSQNPRAFKGLDKSSLPVFWRWNKKGWVTQEIFTDWYKNYFCPTVLKFCDRNNLPKKAILLLDNAPGHPKNLDTLDTGLDVKVIYMPPNTTSVLQPMDQGVISTFKAYYLRLALKAMIKAIDTNSNQTVKDYWRSYDILKGLQNLKSAWNEVTKNCLNGVWRKLLPGFIQGASVEVVNNINEDIIKFTRECGFEDVTTEDVTELLDVHDQPLSNQELEELMEAYDRPQSENPEEEGDEEENDRKILKTDDLTRILSSIERLTAELCEIDGDYNRSANVKRSVTAAVRRYAMILQERKQQSKQMKLDAFFKKV